MAVSTAASDLSARRVLKRLLRLCWQHREACLQVFLSQLLALCLGLIGLGLTGLGIDFLRHRLDPETPAPRWPLGFDPAAYFNPLELILSIAGLVLVFALFRGGLSWWAGRKLADLVHRQIVPDLQAKVFAKLQRLHFRFFDLQDSGSIINRATGDIQAVRTFVETVLIQTLVTLISLGVYAAYMASIHPPLTLACLATLPFLWAACIVFSRAVHPEYLQNRRLFDRMILSLAETIQGIGVIKGFNREPEMTARFEQANAAVRSQQKRIFWRVSTFSPVIDFLTQLSLATLLLYGGILAIRGEIPLGAGLVVFAGLLQQFANQVSTTAQIANGVQESLTGARRVFEILDAPLGIESPAHPVTLNPCRGEIQFDKVHFSYLERNTVLDGVSFTVPAGACVAIVGETGSGKSALLSLIPRFYDPTSGCVRLDGVDLRQLDVDVLRRQVGIVFQESFVFSDTVATNIAFGKPNATQAEIEAAAKIAQAHEFILQLPQGYETVLGESGVDLSGGQRQRLAIARALLPQPSVLLLDDPTAAIDPETEHEILTAIENAIVGRTTFVVAHRLSTLRRADFILVLEQGRIVQQGKHEDLMLTEGPYQRAALLQMVDDESRRALARFTPAILL